MLWGRRYDGHDADPFWIDDIPYAMALDADGSTIFVTGGSGHRVYGNTSYGRRRAPDYATVAYDASTGRELWVRRFEGRPRDDWDIAKAIAVAPDGSRIFVSGESFGRASLDFVTVAYAV